MIWSFEIWPKWTAISKRPGRRTKRPHIISSGPEHLHPSNGGPSIWPQLSGASKGLRLISGDVIGNWINKNSGRNTIATKDLQKEPGILRETDGSGPGAAGLLEESRGGT